MGTNGSEQNVPSRSLPRIVQSPVAIKAQPNRLWETRPIGCTEYSRSLTP